MTLHGGDMVKIWMRNGQLAVHTLATIAMSSHLDNDYIRGVVQFRVRLKHLLELNTPNHNNTPYKR